MTTTPKEEIERRNDEMVVRHAVIISLQQENAELKARIALLELDNKYSLEEIMKLKWEASEYIAEIEQENEELKVRISLLELDNKYSLEEIKKLEEELRIANMKVLLMIESQESISSYLEKAVELKKRLNRT